MKIVNKRPNEYDFLKNQLTYIWSFKSMLYGENICFNSLSGFIF